MREARGRRQTAAHSESLLDTGGTSLHPQETHSVEKVCKHLLCARQHFGSQQTEIPAPTEAPCSRSEGLGGRRGTVWAVDEQCPGQMQTRAWGEATLVHGVKPGVGRRGARDKGPIPS